MNASGETIDMKPYEADMRHLIDTYIEADEPRKISPFDGMPLLELLVRSGIGGCYKQPSSSLDQERQESNRRDHREQCTQQDRQGEHEGPCVLQQDVHHGRGEKWPTSRAKRIEYQEFLEQIAELAKKVQNGEVDGMPKDIDTPGLRALYNNLGNKKELALSIDGTVKRVRPDNWRGNRAKENEIKRALLPLLDGNESEVERIFKVIEQHKEEY